MNIRRTRKSSLLVINCTLKNIEYIICSKLSFYIFNFRLVFLISEEDVFVSSFICAIIISPLSLDYKIPGNVFQNCFKMNLKGKSTLNVDILLYIYLKKQQIATELKVY